MNALETGCVLAFVTWAICVACEPFVLADGERARGGTFRICWYTPHFWALDAWDRLDSWTRLRSRTLHVGPLSVTYYERSSR
jgi:hypothetical protein